MDPAALLPKTAFLIYKHLRTEKMDRPPSLHMFFFANRLATYEGRWKYKEGCTAEKVPGKFAGS